VTVSDYLSVCLSVYRQWHKQLSLSLRAARATRTKRPLATRSVRAVDLSSVDDDPQECINPHSTASGPGLPSRLIGVIHLLSCRF